MIEPLKHLVDLKPHHLALISIPVDKVEGGWECEDGMFIPEDTKWFHIGGIRYRIDEIEAPDPEDEDSLWLHLTNDNYLPAKEEGK